MANRYWVQGTGGWGDAANHWSNSSGGAPGSSYAPTSSDNCYFDEHSNEPTDGDYTVTITNTISSCLNFSAVNPPSGIITIAGIAGFKVYGDFLVGSGIAWTNTGSIQMSATSTGKTFTSNGLTFSSVFSFTGEGGGWTLQDHFVSTTGMNLLRGTLNTGNFNITCTYFIINTLKAVTFNAGTSTLNVLNTWEVENASLLTYDWDEATFNIGNATTGNIYFKGGGLSYTTVIMNNGGTVQGSNTITNFTCELGESPWSSFILFYTGATAQTITNLTLSGYAQNNLRLCVFGYDEISITAAAANVSLENVDLKYIKAISDNPWAGTSLGNLGANTNITFTEAVTYYWIGGTGAWYEPAHWSTSSGGEGSEIMPLVQDVCIFDNNSFTGSGQVVNTYGWDIGKMDWSAVTQNNPTLQIDYNTFFYNDCILSDGMTFDNSEENYVSFQMYDNDIHLTSAGHDLVTFTVQGILGKTFTLMDDVTASCDFYADGEGIIFDANNKNITLYYLYFYDTTVKMGNGIWTIIGGYVEIRSSCTIDGDEATIKFDYTYYDDYIYATLGGNTFYKLWVTSTCSGLKLDSEETFKNIVLDAGCQFFYVAPGVTITVTENFTAIGTAENYISIYSDDPDNPFIMTKPSGNVECDYLKLTNSTVTGGANWYAGSNSVNVSNNSGWIWGDSSTSSSTSSSTTSSTSSSTSSSTTSSTSSSTSSSTTLIYYNFQINGDLGSYDVFPR